MEFPHELMEIVNEEVRLHQDSVLVAIERAESRIRKMPNFKDWIESFIHQAIADLVYDCRSKYKHEQKKDAGRYVAAPGVSAQPSKAVSGALQSAYDMLISKTVLGNIYGKELPEIADGEAARADGHMFNARLCRRLIPMVPAEKMVREAGKEQKLRKIIYEIREGMGVGDAAVETEKSGAPPPDGNGAKRAGRRKRAKAIGRV